MIFERIAKLLARAAAPANVGQTPADVVHRENKWQLLRYRARPQGLAFETPILLVPSLINRHYVLDLMPGKSFVEWLVARGHDVFIIDWGTPEDEDRFLSFDDICGRYLARAINKTARLTDCERIHVLGYCLGGTLVAIHAAAGNPQIGSLVTLAAPVDFDDGGLLSRWTQSPKFDIEALVQACGNVPWPLMQLSFHMLRPTMNLSKAVYAIDNAWDDAFLDGFFALERWGNDNVSFPGACYLRYIQALYRDNALIKGEMTLQGRPARLEDITCPSLVVTFAHDNIVPEKSAAPLVELMDATDKERLHLHGGHVGAVVSRKASTGLWPKLAGFWEARDGVGREPVKPADNGTGTQPR